MRYDCHFVNCHVGLKSLELKFKHERFGSGVGNLMNLNKIQMNSVKTFGGENHPYKVNEIKTKLNPAGRGSRGERHGFLIEPSR